MLDQLSKNITRCGLSNSTLNYLRVRVPGAEWAVQGGVWKRGGSVSEPVSSAPGLGRRDTLEGLLALAMSNLTSVCSPQLCVILEPMQELMSRHKTYSLSPRDCLKTCLFQKWQRMVAPPGECCCPLGCVLRVGGGNAGGGVGRRSAGADRLPLPPGPAEPARQQPSKRRKRKMSGGSTMSSGGGNTNNSNSKKKSPASTFALSSQVPVSIPFPFSLPSPGWRGGLPAPGIG